MKKRISGGKRRLPRMRDAARARVAVDLRVLIKGTVRDFVDIGAVKRGGLDLDAAIYIFVEEVLAAEQGNPA